MAAAANVPAAQIGIVGGDRIRISVAGERVLDEPLAAMELIWSTAIEAYFERRRAVA
jgi:phosphoribosylformylglycinamidine synthase